MIPELRAGDPGVPQSPTEAIAWITQIVREWATYREEVARLRAELAAKKGAK